MFRIRLNIAESKRAELAISATESTTDSSEKTREKTKAKTREKTREKIIQAVKENPLITTNGLAETLGITVKGV